MDGVDDRDTMARERVSDRSRALTLPYRTTAEYRPVDIAQLRPKDSYRQLIAKRTHTIDALIAEHGRIPEDLLLRRRCPSCDADDPRPELEKDHLALVRCVACDTVYVSPAFDEDHYRLAYASADYRAIVRDLGESSHDYRVQRFGMERVDTMSRFLRAGEGVAPSYLDVGCSTGFVVEAARARGWRATGLDLNTSAVAFGQRRGLDLRVGTLEDAGFARHSFDAISLFDVLEHLLHPVRTLTAALELLRPGGIVYLYVPNYDSASRLLMGADAHFIWPTHHLNYYTPNTLSRLLERHGLTVGLVQTEGLDFVDYIWQRREIHGESMDVVERIADTLQFLANAGGYGKNLRMLARWDR
jgi:2-polyprenyl-3-methyl-5-hydroxy-6-metoxy-1,4-benzoquinol methylase